jgi:hypothetical protein
MDSTRRERVNNEDIVLEPHLLQPLEQPVEESLIIFASTSLLLAYDFDRKNFIFQIDRIYTIFRTNLLQHMTSHASAVALQTVLNLKSR